MLLYCKNNVTKRNPSGLTRRIPAISRNITKMIYRGYIAALTIANILTIFAPVYEGVNINTISYFFIIIIYVERKGGGRLYRTNRNLC